ncbi:MAG: zinc-ribbon domain-containing protein [Deltaproteobacteria bacterium]|nr:zinc-ribbon domain-containing protein [Deltaproteobacteria bacterium]
MKISCPECRHGSDIDPKKVPTRTVTAKCPKCGHRFPFSVDPAPPEAQPKDEAAKPAEPRVVPFIRPKGGQEAKPSRNISFHGEGLSLLRLYLVSNLLTVLTLGVYYFWGKAKIRRYIYSSTEFMGERFSYSGTGKELFTGWLRATAVMAVAFGVPKALSSFVHPGFGVLVVPVMFMIVPVALVGAWRYRLSRTDWHGARFSFSGTVKEYLKIHVKGSLLTLITLGFYSPYFHVQKERFWRTNTCYGTARFDYTGKGEDLKKDFLKAFLLFIPTFGLYWFWYKAAVTRYDWEHTTQGGLSFKFSATGRQFLTFSIGNLLLLALSLGFAYPWVITRSIRFTSEHLTVEGDIEFNKVGQTAQHGRAVGEGLAGMLDIDMAL